MTRLAGGAARCVEDAPRAQWQTVCRLEDIPMLGARRIERAAGLAVAVFRTAEDQVFALLDRCPHRGGPLSQGIVFGDSVACPLHNWTIGLDNGCARQPDEGCTPRFSVRLQDGAVQLDAQELATRALDHLPPVAPGNRPVEVQLAVFSARR